MPLPLFSPSPSLFLIANTTECHQQLICKFVQTHETANVKKKKKSELAQWFECHMGEFQFVHESNSRFLKASERLKCKCEVLSGYSVVMWVWHCPWVEKEILYAAQWAAGGWYKPCVDAANTVKDNSFLEMNKTGNSASNAQQAFYHRKVCGSKPLEGKSKGLYIYLILPSRDFGVFNIYLTSFMAI